MPEQHLVANLLNFYGWCHVLILALGRSEGLELGVARLEQQTEVALVVGAAGLLDVIARCYARWPTT